MNTKRDLIHRLPIVASIVMLSGIIPANAMPLGNTTPSGPIVIILPPQKPKDPALRPKAPNRQEVYGTYADGNVVIDFTFPEGICELQFVNTVTGEIISATFDSENPEAVYVGYHDAAEITVATEYGHILSFASTDFP